VNGMVDLLAQDDGSGPVRAVPRGTGGR
jgi:hypothetical protein